MEESRESEDSLPPNKVCEARSTKHVGTSYSPVIYSHMIRAELREEIALGSRSSTLI